MDLQGPPRSCLAAVIFAWLSCWPLVGRLLAACWFPYLQSGRPEMRCGQALFHFGVCFVRLCERGPAAYRVDPENGPREVRQQRLAKVAVGVTWKILERHGHGRGTISRSCIPGYFSFFFCVVTFPFCHVVILFLCFQLDRKSRYAWFWLWLCRSHRFTSETSLFCFLCLYVCWSCVVLCCLFLSQPLGDTDNYIYLYIYIFIFVYFSI